MSPTQRTDVPLPVGKARTSQGSGQGKMPPRRTWPWLLLVLVANFLLVRTLMPSQDTTVTVPYTPFKEQVIKGNVQAIYPTMSAHRHCAPAALKWPSETSGTSTMFEPCSPASAQPTSSTQSSPA
jgi:hypothetical protein